MSIKLATLDFQGETCYGGIGQCLNARTSQENFNRDGGRGGRGKGGNKIICQICGRAGHVTVKCYHQFDITFQGNQGNNQSTNFSENQSVNSNGYQQ